MLDRSHSATVMSVPPRGLSSSKEGSAAQLYGGPALGDDVVVYRWSSAVSAVRRMTNGSAAHLQKVPRVHAYRTTSRL
jgi:hypothetical protein